METNIAQRSIAEVRERPILFSGEMVRVILDGRKTQTRRVMNPQPVPSNGWDWSWPIPKKFKCTPGSTVYWADGSAPGTATTHFYSPYGQPGERLWVREAWAAPHNCDHLKPREIAPGTRIHYRASWEGPCGLLWRPSIFMPRWASRINLERTKTRAERLQEISEEDARAEGVWTDSYDMRLSQITKNHIGAYRTLWDSINGKKYPWSSNPWVWVIEFKRLL